MTGVFVVTAVKSDAGPAPLIDNSTLLPSLLGTGAFVDLVSPLTSVFVFSNPDSVGTPICTGKGEASLKVHPSVHSAKDVGMSPKLVGTEIMVCTIEAIALDGVSPDESRVVFVCDGGSITRYFSRFNALERGCVPACGKARARLATRINVSISVGNMV
jgi:hypothetical protein